MKTSLEFSKKLKEAGFDKKVERAFIVEKATGKVIDNIGYKIFELSGEYNVYPIYDLLNDLCVTYAKELFGDGLTSRCEKVYIFMARLIIKMAVTKHSQETIENTIWETCILNKESNYEAN